MRKKVKEWWKCFGDGCSMYFMAVVGVMSSQYISLMSEGRKFQLDIDLDTLAVSLVIAFIVIYMLDKDGEIEGKLKNWKRRAGSALFAGAFWYSILGG